MPANKTYAYLPNYLIVKNKLTIDRLILKSVTFKICKVYNCTEVVNLDMFTYRTFKTCNHQSGYTENKNRNG